jgi:RNA polymerase subunit RPABC4/transcription elongation factor Spt4
MSDEDIPMAQCGACDSIIPLDSESCPECNVRFGGMSEEELGECGACQAIIPADSTSCSNCGAVFVEQEPIVEETVVVPAQIPESTAETPEADEIQETSAIVDAAEEPEDSEVADEIEELLETPVAQVDDTHNESDASEENEVEVESTEEDESTQLQENIEESEEDIPDITDEEPSIESEDSGEVSDDAIESEEEIDYEEDSLENMMDDLVDDLEDEESVEGVEEEVIEEEKEPEKVMEESEIVMAFENLALAIAAKGMTAAEAFGEMDSSDDHLIDAPELQKGIEKIAGEKLVPKQVTAILNYLDTDGDRRVDPNELVKALEDLRIGIQPGKLPKVKSFPSPLQKFLMGKKANDIVYPIAYFLMVTFIGLWVVNGMGLLVDGTGGTVVYEGGTDQWGGEITQANWNLCQSDALDEMIDPCQGTVSIGETYPCDPALDPNKCQNSLTPFSGTDGASSMPAAFYGDGVFMIILGVIGLAATAYLHLMYAPSLRERAKNGNNIEEESEDEDDSTTDESEEEPEEDESEEEEDYEEEGSALDAPVDLEIAEESDDEDDEEEYDDDDIDVGDWIGLELDGEEFFGEIVEFDDDEGTVTIETEDGEEITGDQEDMFLDDE